jgi:hypothetical protein
MAFKSAIILCRSLRTGAHINFYGHGAGISSGERSTAILSGIIPQAILALTRAGRQGICGTGRVGELEFIRPQLFPGTSDHIFIIYNSSTILTL